MRYFNKLLLVVVLLFVNSCAFYHYKKLSIASDAPPIAPVFSLNNKALYSASIGIRGERVSGLVAMKRMKTGEIRVVFMLKPGVKLVEFRCRDDQCTPTFILPALEHTDVPRKLGEDFALLFLTRRTEVRIDRTKQEFVYLIRAFDALFLFHQPKATGRVSLIEAVKGGNHLKISISGYNADGTPQKVVIVRRHIRVELTPVQW